MGYCKLWVGKLKKNSVHINSLNKSLNEAIFKKYLFPVTRLDIYLKWLFIWAN